MGRRANGGLNSDHYDPKSKANNMKTVYIIIGIIGLVIGLFVIYKLMATSSSPTAVSDGNTYQQIPNQEKSEHHPPGIPRVGGVFGGKIGSKLERRDNLKTNMRDMRMPKDIDPLLGVPDMDKMKNLLNKGPYSDRGEGPIFNQHYQMDGKPSKNKLSPHEVKQKLNAARARFNAKNQKHIERREEM